MNNRRKQTLENLTRILGDIVTSSEDDFMNLGMNLQEVQLMSSAQRQKISAIMGMFKSSQNEGLMPQIMACVEDSRVELKDAEQSALTLCDNLAATLGVMAKIDKISEKLERSGMLLHVIGINTGIECSRTSQIESSFKVVASDTINLAEQIHKATNILLDRSSHVQKEQKRTHKEALHSIADLNAYTDSSNTATEVALQKVKELVDYSIAMVDKAEQMSVNITSAISQVVIGIQFHDNLRQRIEHVNDSLLENLDLSTTDEERTCENYLTLELQQAQLRSLVDELEELFVKQSGNLDEIVKDISSLETNLALMGNEQGGQQDDAFAVLLQGIGSLEEVSGKSRVIGVAISESFSREGQLVEQMQTAIKTTFAIANHVKINALNAIIKAAKFGPAGMALEVLAQGMVDVSKQTRTLVNDFNSLLDRLQELSHDQSEHHEHSQQSEQVKSEELQAIFTRVRADLKNSQADCHNLTENLAVQIKDLIFIQKLKKVIAAQAEELDRYLHTVHPPDQQQLEQLRKSFGAHLAARYTMEEERVVHRALGLPLVAAVAAADDALFFDDLATPNPTSSQPAGEIDLFDDAAKPVDANDDVELWSDPPAPASSAGVELFDSPAAPQETDADEIELWDSGPVEDPASGPDDSAAAEVELWGAPAADAGMEESTEDSVELWGMPAQDGAPDDEKNTKAEAPTTNIELWGDEPATPATELQGASVDVELWDQASTEEAATNEDMDTQEKNTQEKSKTAAENFGDNVELF